MARQYYPPVEPPWADGHVPPGKKTAFNEKQHPVLGHRVARSFRAALLHKLEVIMNAHGGYGRGGLEWTAKALGLHPQSIRTYLFWRCAPVLPTLERIDDLYEDALALLAEQHLQRKSKYAARRRRERSLEEELQSLVDERGL